MNTRENYPDYLRALAIILVVVLHVGFMGATILTIIAMPTFFFSSGYFYRKKEETWATTLQSDFGKLMKPFYFYMLIYAFIEMFRGIIFQYGGPGELWLSFFHTVWGSAYIPVFGELPQLIQDSLPAIRTVEGCSLNTSLPATCHLWFLPAMFTGGLLFKLIMRKTSRSSSRLLLIPFLILFAMVEVLLPDMVQFPLGIGRGALAAGWMIAGYEIRQRKLVSDSALPVQITLFILGAASIFLSAYLKVFGAQMYLSIYGNDAGALGVPIAYIGGLGGTICFLVLFRWIDQLPLKRFKAVLSAIGRNTLTIYIWHMAVKFVLDLIYSLIIGRVPSFNEQTLGLLPSEAAPYMIFETIFIIAACTLAAVLKEKKMQKEKV